MEATIQILLVIIAGGMFGVILGKFLNVTPDWVFWLIILLFFLVLIFVFAAT